MAKSKKNTVPEMVIDDSNFESVIGEMVDGEYKGHGLVPRDLANYPKEMFAPPSDLVLIPRSEWSDRIKEMEQAESRTSDILLRGGVPSLDQGQAPYCWAHSTVGCVQAVRAINNQPYVPLSAFAVAATIKKGAQEGGWAGLSAKFIRERGVPSQQLWPQGNSNYRQFDKPTVWENAALHKTMEDWVDLTREVYDQNLGFDQLATCLLLNIPCATDWNFWSHSTMSCDLVEVEAGDFGVRIRNSWGPNWPTQGAGGFGILRGAKCIPDGALAIRASGASPA